MTQEIPGRHYDDDELWQNISKCTVQLAEESEHERGKRVVRELQTEEEHLLDKFTDVLYSQGNGDSESEETNNEDQLDTEDGVIDPAVLAGRMEIDREHDDDRKMAMATTSPMMVSILKTLGTMKG